MTIIFPIFLNYLTDRRDRASNRRLQEERLGGYARIAVHGFTAGHDFRHTIRQRSLQLAGFIPRCR
jgi:hypothetical protein